MLSEMSLLVALVLLLLVVIIVALMSRSDDKIPKEPFETRPAGTNVPVGTTGTVTPIIYRGGPMIASPNVYLIWYGSWSASHKQLIKDFIYGLNNSPYYGVTKTYSKPGKTITGRVRFNANANEYNDGYSKGKKLSDRNIMEIVQRAMTKLPVDVNGAYFVLTSPDVTATSGFCTRYCGWHSYFVSRGKSIKYSFVGDPKNCMSACAVQNTGPNGTGNESIDAMLSVIAHELTEMATNPTFNTWYDAKGYENADKCAWTYGSVGTAKNGSKFNVTLPKQGGGSRQYLLQRNLNAKTNKCVLS